METPNLQSGSVDNLVSYFIQVPSELVRTSLHQAFQAVSGDKKAQRVVDKNKLCQKQNDLSQLKNVRNNSNAALLSVVLPKVRILV